MRAAPFIAVLEISLFLAPLSYAQHGGGHMGGGFSGHGNFSFGHSSGRGHFSHSTSRFVSGIRHLVPGFWRSPKPIAASTDSLATERVGRDDSFRRPIIGTRPPLFLRRPPFRNPCFGHAFCAAFDFGFGSPLLCDPLFGFGRCFPFFGLTFAFQGDSFFAGAGLGGETSSASEAASLSSTSAASTDRAEPDHPITLLQLKNGWMYGLTDYWVKGANLHYVTNYGGRNSVPLDLVDLAATIRLNSERGVEFSLYTKRDKSVPVRRLSSCQKGSSRDARAIGSTGLSLRDTSCAVYP